MNTNKRQRINRLDLVNKINFFLRTTDPQTIDIIQQYLGGWVHFNPHQPKQIKHDSGLELITLVRLYNTLIKMQPRT
jgi:hypothetical protein